MSILGASVCPSESLVLSVVLPYGCRYLGREHRAVQHLNSHVLRPQSRSSVLNRTQAAMGCSGPVPPLGRYTSDTVG
jgi:hypothetical protein